jgi:hypothetical protein
MSKDAQGLLEKWDRKLNHIWKKQTPSCDGHEFGMGIFLFEKDNHE